MQRRSTPRWEEDVAEDAEKDAARDAEEHEEAVTVVLRRVDVVVSTG